MMLPCDKGSHCADAISKNRLANFHNHWEIALHNTSFQLVEHIRRVALLKQFSCDNTCDLHELQCKVSIMKVNATISQSMTEYEFYETMLLTQHSFLTSITDIFYYYRNHAIIMASVKSSCN